MGISTRFRIRTKLMLSALAFIVPIGTMAGLIVQGYTYDIRFSTLEQYGNRIIAPLMEIAATAVLSAGADGAATGPTATEAEQRADRAAEQLRAAHQSVGEDLQFTPAGLALRGRDTLMPPAVITRWEAVKRLTGTARVDATAEFFADVTEMIVHAGDTSNLILDPDLDSYYLMDVTLLGVPALLTGIYSAASTSALSATDAA